MIGLLNNSFFAKMICHVYLFYANIMNSIIPYITFFFPLQIQREAMLTGCNLDNVVNSGALNKGGMGGRAKKGVTLLTYFPFFNLKSGKRG